MKIEAAVVKEQGVTFAVVVVKQSILSFPNDRENLRSNLGRYFPAMPIILMGQDSRGVPKYHGRTDIVNFLARVHISQLPWKDFYFNN